MSVQIKPPTLAIENQNTLQVVNEYIDSLRFERKSDDTIYTYTSVLNMFFTKCTKNIADIGFEDVLNWYEKYKKGKSNKTKCCRLTVLSSFFTYCVKNGYIDYIPVKQNWRPRTPKSIPKFLERKYQTKIKIVADKAILRDRAILETLESSGVRVSELTNINVCDIDFGNRIIKVLGKGEKERYVHISEKAAYLVQKLCKGIPATSNSPVFRTIRSNERMDRRDVGRRLAKIKKQAGLDTLGISFSPHVCRHNFATNLLQNGANLDFVSAELGHTNLTTTKIYTKVAVRDPKVKVLYHKTMR